MNELIAAMRVAFANNFTWYLQAHNYHWNVGGPDFPQYHKFLNEIYDDAQDAIDDYAEKVRQLGAFAQGNYPDIIAESQLSEPLPGLTDPGQMFVQLLSDHDIMLNHLADTYDLAGEQREYGIQNFLAERMDTHKQQGWMLRAILNQLP
jgi:starvation-inducible DNA-binding protein